MFMGLFGPTSLLAYTNAPAPTVKVTTSAPNTHPIGQAVFAGFLGCRYRRCAIILTTGPLQTLIHLV